MIKNYILPIIFLGIITGCTVNNNITPSSSPSVIPTISPTPVIIEKGILQGHLTIGPLCPLEPCNISDEQKRQAYESRKIQIYTNNNNLIKETLADYKTGIYSLELQVGNYLVKVTNGNLNNFPPKQISIEAGKTLTLDLDVDTGIR